MKNQNQPFIYTGSTNETHFGAVRVSACENGEIIKDTFINIFDILVRETEVGKRKFVFSNCDGLTNSRSITEAVMKPLLNFDGKFKNRSVLSETESLICNTEVKREASLDSAVKEILRGSLVIFVDGETECLIVGVQNLPERAPDEPDTEIQERGSREGFVENLKTNLTLVRKRLCTVDFKVEAMEIGKTGNTRIAVCYMDKKYDIRMLEEVKTRLKATDFDMIYGASYLRKCLDTKRKSMFSMVGLTERPDTFCAKINEGKIGIIVDGTPFAIVVPVLFCEHFSELDDYYNRTYFASFMRIIRFTAFIISVFLPGVFVAICLFHQELLPDDMLYNIVLMESNTLFTLTVEALLIHLIYEFVREAGIRMPKSVGHAVSIVGALVIGDAAVSAGLIGAPMLIIVALSAITSLVTSELYQPSSVLRLIFIVVGGFSGLYGITLGAALLIMNLCSVTDYGVCYMSPFIPYSNALWRDTFIRTDVDKLGKRLFNINKLKTR